MNLSCLKAFADFLNQNTPQKINAIKRIGDNLLKFEIHNQCFYFDLTKGRSLIFIADDSLIPHKNYQAPFDKSLQKYCLKAMLKEAKIDGFNRILQLFLENKNHYKAQTILLQAEFTGKNTNLILLDSQNRVLDALRHITPLQSFREVKIGKTLLPLPQPKTPPNLDISCNLHQILRQNYLNLQASLLEQKKQKSIATLQKKLTQTQKLLSNLGNETQLLKDSKQYFTYGQNLLANLYLYPDFKGSTLKLKNLTIPIPKEAKNLSSAAQIYFNLAKKLDKKAKNLHLQAQNLQARLDFQNQLLIMIQNVTNLQDLAILNSNFQKDSHKKQNHETKKYESFFIEGYKISVGRNQKENIALLKDAKAEDMWLHIQDIPSSHLIIHCGKSKIPDIILQKASRILVGFTKSFAGNYAIDYTKRKFVKITQGANVLYNHQQTLHITKD